MKNLFITFIVLSIFIINVKAQNKFSHTNKKDQNNFREGIFRYEEPPYNNTTVIRSKKYQEENHLSTNVKIRFKIHWVSNFEYHLTFNKVSDKSGACLLGKVIKVKILEANENSWKINTEFQGKFTTFTMTKIRSLPKRKLHLMDKEN